MPPEGGDELRQRRAGDTEGLFPPPQLDLPAPLRLDRTDRQSVSPHRYDGSGELPVRGRNVARFDPIEGIEFGELDQRAEGMLRMDEEFLPPGKGSA